MSFQRILETARRMNSPLIVTDPAGREPMVIMTLQAYERLGEGELVVHQKPKSSEVRSVSQESPLVETIPIKEVMVEKAESSQVLQEIAIQTMESTENSKDSEISMEDRFYLEPMDPESN